MIKNERQYRIIKSQANKFREYLEGLSAISENGKDLGLLEVERSALVSQLEDFNQDLKEYEDLRDGKYKVLEVHSFDDLPQALIKARIAAGLSQKDLADTLGLKEQQLQRYEASGYASASLQRIKMIISALGIRVKEEVFLSTTDLKFSNLLKSLKTLGLENTFVQERLLPKQSRSILDGVSDEKIGEKHTLQVVSRLSRIFGVDAHDILSGKLMTSYHFGMISATKFKKPKNSAEKKTNPYVVYAHYLALLLLESTRDLPQESLSSDPLTVLNEINARFGEISFETSVRYVWSKGIPVLPLNDPGAFHGACWRINGRNVIVLKQKTKYAARWLFDLLHEYYHSSVDPDEENFTIIETEESKEKYEIDEEFEASRFAGEVGLKLRGEFLVEKCVSKAQGSVERLKQAVIAVGREENVSIDVLANYLAFRLMLQKISWWGAANNLQDETVFPLQIARNLCMENMDLSNVNPIDREILLQALSDDGG